MCTAAEESGPQDYIFSHTGYEPNDHLITEAYVEYTQESLTEQLSPEGFDYDDITIGQTLQNACRRRADHSEEEGLSSCLSSSSMSHDRTVRQVVCSLVSGAQETQRHSSVTKFRDKTLKANIVGLSWTNGSKSKLTVKRRLESTNSRLIMTEEENKN